MATPQDFRTPARQDVALVFAERQRTLYEASKALGRHPGSIANLVKRMTAEGLLIADTDPPVRGTMYQLHPAARDALDAALSRDVPPGKLMQGQTVLLVEGSTDFALFQRLLAKTSLSAGVVWAARIDSGDALLALSPDASPLQADKLLVALGAAGFTCSQRQISHLMSGDELRRRAVALAGVAEEVAADA